MTLPFETPQDYYDYFYDMMLNAKPSNPKWEVGFRAAKLWREYCEQDHIADDTQTLVSLVRIIMPFRLSGSGILMLWEKILGHLTQLPIHRQKMVWSEIFDISNQGEEPIESSDLANKVLRRWVELAESASVTKINVRTLNDIANETSSFYMSNREWMAFIEALNNWFKLYIDKPTLLECIYAKLKSHST